MAHASLPSNCRSVARTACRFALTLALLLAARSATHAAGDDGRMTFDWIFSDAGKAAAAVPTTRWLDDGRLLLLDLRVPETERTFEVLDPASGARKPWIDRQRALQSLNALLQADEPADELTWPDALDTGGRHAVWVHGGDLYVLDPGSSAFRRLTETVDEEKSPRISPDGKQVAYVRANDLYVRGIDSGDEKRLTTGGSDTLLNGTVSWVYWEEVFGRSDLGFEWSPRSDAIVYLQTDESGVGEMVYPDFEPNVPRLVRQRYPKTGEANPRVRAGVVALESAKTTWIDLGVYPYEYLARVTWLEDGKRLALQTLDRPQTTLDLFLADAATGGVRHVMRETDPGWINLHDDLYFLEDGQRFLWVSERDGYPHLYLHGADGATIRQVTRGDWSLRSSGGAVFWLRQAVQSIDEKNGQVWFTATEKSSIERQLYRIDLDGTGLERVTQEDGTHSIQFSPDGRWYVDTWSSTDSPPEMRVRRADGSREVTVAPARPEAYADVSLLPGEHFTIPAKDGFAMPAYVVKPRGFEKGKRYPVVLYVYGGPSAPTIANAWQAGNRPYFEQMLADDGIAAVRVDNRCATSISKTLENTYSGYGPAELADVVDAARWLKQQPWVDPERVGIWGWSGGGSFTLLAMTGSEEFRAGIAVAAVSDWRYYDTKWAEAFMKRPDDRPDEYAATSHAARAAKLHGRLMLVHGTYDDNVHPQNVWRFADELIDAGITFDMMIYPMRKHGITDDEAQRHLYTTMLEFWRRNLK